MKSVLSALFSPTPTPVPVLRSQRNRRILVALTAGLVVVGVVFSLTHQGTLGLLVAILAYAMVTVLNYATRNISSTIDASADEREQHLRDRTHRLAYWTLTGIIGVIVGGFWGAYTADPTIFKALLERFTVTESLGLTLSFGTLTYGLPVLILAWLEPAPILED